MGAVGRLLDRLLEPLEIAVDWFVAVVPGRVVAIVSLLFYPGLGLLLPYVLNWPRGWFLTANLLGTTVAAILTVGWISAQVDLARRRHLVDWTTDLRRLDSDEFEWFVAEIFTREEWTVKHRGRPDAADGRMDGGITASPRGAEASVTSGLTLAVRSSC
jgi:hypothetical protein